MLILDNHHGKIEKLLQAPQNISLKKIVLCETFAWWEKCELELFKINTL